MIAACARVGANAPNGGEEGSLAGAIPGGVQCRVKIFSPENCECHAYIADFAGSSNDARIPRQICRSTIFSLSSAIASAGLRPFGQALAQFMMVWQR